jgi:hypothetical protein
MAAIIPFAALYLSDLALNNLVYAEYYSGFYWGVNGFVYIGFGLTVLIGFGLLRQRAFTWLRLGGAVAGSTVLFFLVTNFGAWLGSPLYAQSTAGLLAAYAAGLPFLLNSVAGTIVFSGILFGGYHFAVVRPALAKQRS